MNPASEVRVMIVAGLVGPTRCRKALVIRIEPRTLISYQSGSVRYFLRGGGMQEYKKGTNRQR